MAVDPIAQPLATQQFNVNGTDINGCRNEDSVEVMVFQLPTLTTSHTDSICVGLGTVLIAEGAGDYIWSTGDDGPSIAVTPGNTTDYWVAPVGPNGCIGDTFDINVYVERVLPLAAFEPDLQEGFYPLPVTFTDESQGATRYSWDFGDGETSQDFNPVHTYNAPGEYEVKLILINEIGCPDSIVYQFIKVNDFNLYTPNIYTPNGDNQNDLFAIRMNSIERFEIRIFDRWGRQVFSSVDQNFFWDGTKNGTPAPEGVYVYQLEAFTFNGERIEREGTVTLVR